MFYYLGGILSQTLTEISGESASGKTQLCMQLCLTVQLPKKLGGLEGGEASFPYANNLVIMMHA